MAVKQKRARIKDSDIENIAKEILTTNKTQTKILKDNGYTGDYVATNTTKILNSTKIQTALNRLKNEVATKSLERIESIANVPIDDALDSKVLPTVLKANQDLLDRAGYNKVQKSMSITKKVTETRDLDDVQANIERLEAELDD